MIIIAVHDDQIALVAAQIDRDYKGIVVHTSGSKPLSTLPSHLAQVAIFYPLYSFHSKRKISFKRIPILVTAKSQKVEETLQKLANSISEKCYVVTDKERATLHLAAVFANNFANFMMTINFDIIERAGLDKEMILPIIKQSATNWSNGEAINKQTGPAVRGDEKTMKSHMTALKNPALEELYHEISKNIIKYYK